MWFKTKKAFGLIDLAIGIVVSGMLVYGAFFGIGLVSKKRTDKLISSMSTIRQSIEIFQTINGFLPGDAFAQGLETVNSSAKIVNTACGNGDGIISWHSRCGSVTCTNCTPQTKCNVALSVSVVGGVAYGLHSETMLFAKHLSDFGILSKTLPSEKSNYYNVPLSAANTVSTGVENTIFLPILFANTAAVPLYGFKRVDSNHTILITSTRQFYGTTDSTNLFNATQLGRTSTFSDSDPTFVFSVNSRCGPHEMFPAGFEIDYKDADYIDKKIDDGIRDTGNVKHCPSATNCDLANRSKVIIGFLQIFASL